MIVRAAPGRRRRAAVPLRTRDATRAGWNERKPGTTTAMQIPGVHIETLHNPTRYTHAQIEKACTIAALLNRGKLVLVEPPRR
jgi:hypothetical protein